MLSGKGERGPRWVVLKLTGEIGDGKFWTSIVDRYSEKLIVVVSADQIRRNDVRVSRGLSWEATAEDLSVELKENPILQPLRMARHLIVTFRCDGAFWFDNKTETKSSLLVFDASRAEGQWETTQGEGTVFGYSSCFTAAIVSELCRSTDPDFEKAITTGLDASRILRWLGHGPVRFNKVIESGGDEKSVDNSHPGFPFPAIAARIAGQKDPDTARNLQSQFENGDSAKKIEPLKICIPAIAIAAKIGEQAKKFVSAPIPLTPRERGTWMMLDEWQVHARTQGLQQTSSGGQPLPLQHALGPGALNRFPVAQFGALQTVDRSEIESLRTLRHLIQTYEGPKGATKQKKPLCLGVFGPPGAGKSFGVTQIAMAALDIKEEDILTFNLSQFSDPLDLIGAYHVIRDRVLTGKTPLVFWDEFDSQGYRWLQYLLAPMQDGAFQQGQITHPIGKCVFVFAGATSQTYETFGPVKPPNPGQSVEAGLVDGVEEKVRPIRKSLLHIGASAVNRDLQEKWLEFVLKKGPDFKSRLVGFLNVLGPNQREKCSLVKGQRDWKKDPKDLLLSDSTSPVHPVLQFKLKDGVRSRD